jgi:23S rRNA (pseudouridine1915-N3)-methyltransferase
MRAVIPKNSRVIALDSSAKAHSSEGLAQLLAQWQQDGRDLCFLIGGPDGLALSILQQADSQLSFGPMTLPHALVRIVLAEQLFRAVSILQNHPYHRAGKVC